MRYQPSEESKVQMAVQADISRAEGDYERLRAAYLDQMRVDSSHEVALAMIGADMDRAHARLQRLIGLPSLPFTHEPSTVLRRAAERFSTEHEHD